MRTALLLALVACNTSSASKLDAPPTPRNLVCERVAILSPKATCSPELSGVGDLATHTARVTVEPGKPAIVCGLNAGQLSMACGTLEVQAVKADEHQPKPQPVETREPKAKK